MVAYKLRWSAVEGLFWVPTLKELWTDDDRYPSSGRGADQTHTKTDKMLYLYCKCCFKWVKVDLHVITGLIHDQYWKIVAQEVFNGWCPDKCWCYAFWIQSLCIPDLSCNLKSELLFIDEAEILSLVSQCSVPMSLLMVIGVECLEELALPHPSNYLATTPNLKSWD